MLERRRDGPVRVHHLKPTALRDGPNTMGYYTRDDLPFFHALADAFTICDHYHCSVIGPTDPNRLYSMTATIDPAGKNGGPSLQTLVTNREQQYGKFTWPTYPEQLQSAGISWKMYSTPDGDYGDNVLPYFKAYQEDPHWPRTRSGLSSPATSRPTARQERCRRSRGCWRRWCRASIRRHPSATGRWRSRRSCRRSSPILRVWEKTALFATYDENGGFFDHVPPPVPPPGTKDEYLTRRTAAEHRRWHPRADRPRLPRAHARHLAVLTWRLRVLEDTSTTPLCCDSWRGASARKCQTSAAGGAGTRET